MGTQKTKPSHTRKGEEKGGRVLREQRLILGGLGERETTERQNSFEGLKECSFSIILNK